MMMTVVEMVTRKVLALALVLVTVFRGDRPQNG